uniref:Uncharacterized protein n=1 Tax=Vespula pensylvanica TaxID=30213 RepID=A0A834JNM5_VESPE|nr:hypothetical protein H0235_017609 [Vespula pensylvanica]
MLHNQPDRDTRTFSSVVLYLNAEEWFKKKLKNLTEERTPLAVAHRLSVLKSSDIGRLQHDVTIENPDNVQFGSSAILLSNWNYFMPLCLPHQRQIRLRPFKTDKVSSPKSNKIIVRMAQITIISLPQYN